jgi:DNA-binding transcriptional MerR regulator
LATAQAQTEKITKLETLLLRKNEELQNKIHELDNSNRFCFLIVINNFILHIVFKIGKFPSRRAC